MKYINLLFFAIILSASFLLAANVFALSLGDAFETKNQNASDPLDTVAWNAGYNISSGQNSATPEKIISLIINTILSILGIVFMSLMIYGGYTWMTAMGDQSKAGKAKDLITAAVIGVILVVAAYAISYFVTSALVSQYITDKKNEQPAAQSQSTGEAAPNGN